MGAVLAPHWESSLPLLNDFSRAKNLAVSFRVRQAQPLCPSSTQTNFFHMRLPEKAVLQCSPSAGLAEHRVAVQDTAWSLEAMADCVNKAGAGNATRFLRPSFLPKRRSVLGSNFLSSSSLSRAASLKSSRVLRKEALFVTVPSAEAAQRQDASQTYSVQPELAEQELLHLAFLFEREKENPRQVEQSEKVNGTLVEPPAEVGNRTEGKTAGLNQMQPGFNVGVMVTTPGVFVDEFPLEQQTPPNPPFKVSAEGRRIVAVGDVHGDWDKAIASFQLAGVLSRDGRMSWIGGSTILVQVGDILDRGGDEIAIMSLLRHLQDEARKHDGAVYQVNGNHETMNVEGDYRFVTDDAYIECEQFVRYCTDYHGGNWDSAFVNWWREAQLQKRSKQPMALGWRWNPLQAHRSQKARAMLFQPGGPLACQMARHGVVLQVEDTLFCHGGVLPHHVNYGLERLNLEVSRWMRGETDARGEEAALPYIAIKGYDSVVWSRLYSHRRYDSATERRMAYAALVAALDAAGVQRQVVGHTPQETGANSEFSGRVWRIDVGMSSGIMDAPPQVLEIVGSTVRVLGTSERQSAVNYV